MTPQDKLIATAAEELYYIEKASEKDIYDKYKNPGFANINKYAAELDKLGVYNGKKQGYNWCDIFVDWCFVHTFGVQLGMAMTYQPMGGYGAGCTESYRYYKNHNATSRIPDIGDQAFYTHDSGKTFYHTGIVVDKTDTLVTIIAGNNAGDPYGGSVQRKTYDQSSTFLGYYGKPDWSLYKGETMTEREFETLFNEMRANWRDNDAHAYSDEARTWAISHGIVSGFADGQYGWEDLMTREQAVTMLYMFDQYLKRNSDK